MVSAPNSPNTVKKPSAIPTVAARARPMPANPRGAASRSPDCCPRTTRSRYAGSMANPHGFSAATNPAAKARPTRPRFTGLVRQSGHSAGQLLLGHRRRRVVDECRAAIGAIEHICRLPWHVVASPDRAVGVVEVGEVQVVLGDEILRCSDIRVRRDADAGDPGIGGRHLADAGSFGVAEWAPRRPEPQHRRLALQAGAIEASTVEGGSGELRTIVGGLSARWFGQPEYQGGGKDCHGKKLERGQQANNHGVPYLLVLCVLRRDSHRCGSQRRARAPATRHRRPAVRRPPLIRPRSSYPPSAASCPQAALISRPRVSRTVHDTPFDRTRRTNSRSTALGLASQSLPGVGLSGIRFTCTSGPSARCSRLPSRSARHGWSLTSRINAYSTDTRRPVTSA